MQKKRLNYIVRYSYGEEYVQTLMAARDVAKELIESGTESRIYKNDEFVEAHRRKK